MYKHRRVSVSSILQGNGNKRLERIAGKMIKPSISVSDVLCTKENIEKERINNQVTFPVLHLKGKKGKQVFDTILNSKPGNYNARKASKEARKYLREQGYYM